MQDDDTANPAMLWVLEGEALWNAKAASGKSCADCHGDASASMKGVAARYPAFDTARGQPVDLEQRINSAAASARRRRRCRSRAASCSRSRPSSRANRAAMPIANERRSAHAAGHRERPRDCSKAGRASSICPARSATTTTGARNSPAASIPQAHPTGYPIYRLEWQSLGSLQRRLRNCLIGMRAETYALGAPDASRSRRF